MNWRLSTRWGVWLLARLGNSSMNRATFLVLYATFPELFENFAVSHSVILDNVLFLCDYTSDHARIHHTRALCKARLIQDFQTVTAQPRKT